MSAKDELKRIVLKSQIDWCDINITQLSESMEYWKNEKTNFISKLKE